MGSEVTKTTMMPQLVDLAGDADGDVRIAAVETAVKLMNFLDAESLRDTVVPMVVEAGDRARSDAEDDVLAKMAHFQVSGTLLFSHGIEGQGPRNQCKQVIPHNQGFCQLFLTGF